MVWQLSVLLDFHIFGCPDSAPRTFHISLLRESHGSRVTYDAVEGMLGGAASHHPWNMKVSCDVIPPGESLPARLLAVRPVADAAVCSDEAKEYETAETLYRTAASYLGDICKEVEEGDPLHSNLGNMTTARALRNMEKVYLQRAKVMAAKATGDDTDSESDSCSEGELETRKIAKLTLRGAIQKVKIDMKARLAAAAFGSLARSANSAPSDKDPTTKRKYLTREMLPPGIADGVTSLYTPGNQPTIIWASCVDKRSVYHRKIRKMKIDKRTMVLTPSAVYIGAKQHIVRCTPVKEISEVVVGDDLWVGLRVPSQYDLLVVPTGSTPEGRDKCVLELIECLTLLGKRDLEEGLR
eukprot:Sspe_Gene.106722::Locus_84795_Transcript_1_1_Confidence_1.000_Length_1147::g.106722::m.106722